MPTKTENRTNSDSGANVLRVLVVDDEPLFGDLIGKLLSDWGHKTLYLDNYDDAIQHVRYMQFDLAFIGAVMPGDDGIDVGALVKTLSPRTRTFLFMEPVAEEWAKSLRQDGYNIESLVGPFEPDHLRDIIDSTMRKKARLRRNHSAK